MSEFHYLLYVPFSISDTSTAIVLRTNADLYDAIIYKIPFHLMACAIIYCATLQDDLLTTGARNATRAKHQSISLSCGQ